MAKKILKKAQYGIVTKKKPVDTRSTNEKIGITRPTESNPSKNGVYRGTTLTPDQIKKSQEDWKKKEREVTNPKNRPAVSPIRQLKKGGSIKKK